MLAAFGSRRNGAAAQDARQVRQAMKLVAPLPVVSLTEADCLQALSNFTAYHLSHGLGLLDSLIAACAVGRSAILCTFNKKHYRMVPGLKTEQPYVK
jgi:predicted nucleic acid-binding protein